jgi:hypothetical protein
MTTIGLGTTIAITWQDAAVAVILLATVAYVARRIVRRIRGKAPPDCGCCPGCSDESPKNPLVSLDRNDRER